MSIIALFVAFFSVVMIACAGVASIIASGSPAYFAGLLYDREAPINRPDHRIGMLTLCGESHTVDRQPSDTLTDMPAIIAPTYQIESVTVMVPRMIGEPRDARGRFMPKYKA